MPILQKASVGDRERLLGLFPVADLRAGFPYTGSKEKICVAAASSNAKSQVDKVAQFVDQNLNVCKQHVRVLSHQGDAELPQNLLGAELVLSAKDHALYLARITYSVVLLDPAEKTSLDFLWPIRIEIAPKHLTVRFVVLEKNLSSYFDREVFVRGKSLDEDAIISGILSEGTSAPADLNKGIKALWATDQFDAIRTRYKKSGSVAWEAMDEERGIKQFNPTLYKELQTRPLYATAFKTTKDGDGIKSFSADPTNGQIGFTRYSKEGGDSDELIRQILKNN